AESQKFPWSPELFPSVLLTNGGILAAARESLQSGSSAALVSGFHHSSKNQGEGFCTFNGLIVALDKLKSENKIGRAAILDMDLHYGNGTAQLATTRPWLIALSLYGNDYLENTPYRDVTVLKHQDGTNHKSAALPAGCDGKTQLQIMEKNLPLLLADGKPDLILYQAGADPYFEDPYSPLSLNHEDLKDRDRRVFQFTREHKIPIAWVLAGGYTQDISKIVKVHVNTFQAWKEVYLVT
ncbi:MAG: histone deacetylase, partial [Bdellovibrionia bacterium]